MRQKWHCPICHESSGRYWNLKRHINRKHAGTCIPVRKYTAFHQQNISSQPFGFQTMRSYLDIQHRFRNTEKRYDTSDSMEKILEPLRKLNEFKILTSQLFPSHLGPISKVYTNLQGRSSPIDFTSRQPVRVRNDNNIPNTSIEDPDIVGYSGYVCLACLTAEPLPIYDDKLGGSEKAVHDCNPKRLEEVRNATNNAEIIQKLYTELPRRMKDTTNAWTKCQNHLIALKIEEADTAVDKITDLTISDNNNWAARVIRDGRTILSEDELMAFLKASNNSTSAYFKIHPSYEPDLVPSCYTIAIFNP